MIGLGLSREREGRFENEGWRVRKDGTRFWASVVIDAIRGDNGALLGFAKVTRDITERRNAQIALEEAREALFHSQKMEALGRLTGGIAHDFNNLLTAILGSLELLRQRLPNTPTDDATRPLDNAVQAGERGAWLTRRMLAFARHQDLVDLQPARSVENLDVATLRLRPVERLAANLDHIVLAGFRPKNGNANLLSKLRQLVDGSGPLKVTCHQQR